jgi:hypothetical protein
MGGRNLILLFILVAFLIPSFARGETNPDGSMVSSMWNFDGDGKIDKTTSTNAVTHAYNNAGTYYARVTVGMIQIF